MLGLCSVVPAMYNYVDTMGWFSQQDFRHCEGSTVDMESEMNTLTVKLSDTNRTKRADHSHYAGYNPTLLHPNAPTFQECPTCCVPGERGPIGDADLPGIHGNPGPDGAPGRSGTTPNASCIPERAFEPPPCLPCPQGPRVFLAILGSPATLETRVLPAGQDSTALRASRAKTVQDAHLDHQDHRVLPAIKVSHRKLTLFLDHREIKENRDRGVHRAIPERLERTPGAPGLQGQHGPSGTPGTCVCQDTEVVVADTRGQAPASCHAGSAYGGEQEEPSASQGYGSVGGGSGGGASAAPAPVSRGGYYNRH